MDIFTFLCCSPSRRTPCAASAPPAAGTARGSCQVPGDADLSATTHTPSRKELNITKLLFTNRKVCLNKIILPFTQNSTQLIIEKCYLGTQGEIPGLTSNFLGQHRRFSYSRFFRLCTNPGVIIRL